MDFFSVLEYAYIAGSAIVPVWLYYKITKEKTDGILFVSKFEIKRTIKPENSMKKEQIRARAITMATIADLKSVMRGFLAKNKSKFFLEEMSKLFNSLEPGKNYYMWTHDVIKNQLEKLAEGGYIKNLKVEKKIRPRRLITEKLTIGQFKDVFKEVQCYKIVFEKTDKLTTQQSEYIELTNKESDLNNKYHSIEKEVFLEYYQQRFGKSYHEQGEALLQRKSKLSKLTSAERNQFNKDYSEFKKQQDEVRLWLKNGAGKEIVEKRKDECLEKIKKIQTKKEKLEPLLGGFVKSYKGNSQITNLTQQQNTVERQETSIPRTNDVTTVNFASGNPKFRERYNHLKATENSMMQKLEWIIPEARDLNESQIAAKLETLWKETIKRDKQLKTDIEINSSNYDKITKKIENNPGYKSLRTQLKQLNQKRKELLDKKNENTILKKRLSGIGVGSNLDKFINNLRSVREAIRRIEEKVGTTEIKTGNEVKNISSKNISSVSFKSDKKEIGG